MLLKDLLLLTKLHLPSLSDHLLSRPRLITRLNEALKRKLTLITASAGYGKTTLLCQWIESLVNSDVAIASVSLDESDNEPDRFWGYLLIALDQLCVGMSDQAFALLHSVPPSPIEAILTTAINALMTIRQHFVLILDGYHVITSQFIHHGLGFLFEHMPPQMHIIILGRSEPSFSLSRLRSHGQVGELHSNELCFTPQEVTAFVQEVMSLNITAEEIATLEMQTEGWAAGIRLAAMSIQERKSSSNGQFAFALTHYHRYIFDYLKDEVFLQQPEHIQTFLLQTSILDCLHGSLCDAVTDNTNSKLLLKQLKQAGVFLVSLGEDEQWYRYHYLFAEFLRSRLKELTSHDSRNTLLATLNNRASIWYQQHGMKTEAIVHALACDECNRVNSHPEQIEVLQKPDEYSSPPIQKQQQGKMPTLLDSLSTREFEVLQCLAEGMSNAEIAARMVIEKNTVKWHLKNIYGKLNVHNRNQAMLKARTLM